MEMKGIWAGSSGIRSGRTRYAQRHATAVETASREHLIDRASSCRLMLAVSIIATLMTPLAANAATILNETLTSGAAGATASRNVAFGPTGAIFDSILDGIDYPDTLFPAQGTIEIVFRTTDTGLPSPKMILDTRGADARLPGDSVIQIADGVVGDISNPPGASAGQIFFTIDPSGGNIPATIPGAITTTALNDGNFHCLAVSYGSSGLGIYADGVLEDSNPGVTASLTRSTVSLGDFQETFFPGGMSFSGNIFYIRTSNTQGDVQLPRTIGCSGALRSPASAPALSFAGLVSAVLILCGFAFYRLRRVTG